MNNIINFGKYKGKSLQDIAIHDYQYLEWLKEQHWIKDDLKIQIMNININGVEKRDNSPQHNIMQLEIYKRIEQIIKNNLLKNDIEKIKEKCINAWLRINHKEIEYKIKTGFIDIFIDFTILYISKDDIGKNIILFDNYQKYSGNPRLYKKEIDDKKIILNENNITNIDNFYFIDDYYHLNGEVIKRISHKFIIEIKPTISDDFMNIIRQISSYNDYSYKKVLIYDSFNVTNISEDDVINIFKNKKIHCFKYNDLIDGIN